MQKLINQNERLKIQNQSLQQENRALREKNNRARKAFRAVLKGSLPCIMRASCTPDARCLDEITNFGKNCMIRIAQKALRELTNEQ